LVGEHVASLVVHYIQAAAPADADSPRGAVQVDDEWTDSDTHVKYRCSSTGPIVWQQVDVLGITSTPDIEISISAASLKGTTTTPAGDANRLPESAETSVNAVNYDYMAFDPTTAEGAFFTLSLPTGWNEGTVTFRVKWTNASGLTTETVVWGLKAVALSDDNALDTAFGSEVTVTDTWLAQNDVHISPESAALTIGGTPAVGDLSLWQITRKTASDNLTGDARLIEIIITFTRDSYSD